MNFKFKALAAAAVMVVAGQASAALSEGGSDNGTLFLTVWDVSTNKSYVRDLGLAINDFLPGPTLTSNAGANVVFGNLPSSTLFTTTFAASTVTNIRWTVVGADNFENDAAANGARIVSVFGSNPGAVFNGSIRGLGALAFGFAGELIANSGVDFTGAPAEYATTGLDATTGGGAGWGPAIPGVGLGGAVISGFGAAGFYLGATSNDTGDNDSVLANPMVRFANSENFATMTLGSNGVLTYNLDPIAAVPVPAAAWLMGAGLMAIGGAMRRRKAAAAAA